MRKSQVPGTHALLVLVVVVGLAAVGGVAGYSLAQPPTEQSASERAALHRAWEAEQRAIAAEAAADAAQERADARADARAARKAQRESLSSEDRGNVVPSSDGDEQIPVGGDATPTPEAAQAPGAFPLTGEFTVPDINGALVTRVGGYPGQPLTTLGMKQLDKVGQLLKSLEAGRTYPCPQGSGGGFADIVPGAQVTVQDGTGAVLATSGLEGGTLGIHGCTFTFRVEVPEAAFYQVTVSHRGALTYSFEDLVDDNWHVAGGL